MRVYFDASVIIAALLSPTGGSAQLLAFVRFGLIKGVTSQTVLDEVFDQDKSERIKRSRNDIEQFIANSGLIVREIITEEEIYTYQGQLEDEDDLHLIAGANLTKCCYLVTLDKKHLLRSDVQKRFLPLLIVSPKELLEELISN